MKVIKISFLALLVFFAGCKKADDASLILSSDEVADFIATSLAANASGLNTVSADITLNAQSTFDLNLGCGGTKTYTVSHSNPPGTANNYNYQLNYNYTINCNANNVPDNITGKSTDSGSFDCARISSTNTGASTFRVAGLTPGAPSYVINGDYKRSGNFTSKVESKTTATTTIDFILTNLTINKATKLITSGTAIVTITGNTSTNAGINLVGSVTFTGNNKATVALNGSIYTVDLLTGLFTK
jgi:hypothetical protein